jgi:ATP-dependent DNA helicase RecQ
VADNLSINYQITQLSNDPISSWADAQLREALHRVWGFSEFRPLQREAMHAVLDGRDSVVVLPTGGGKSLCFQAPAVVEHAMRGPASGGPSAPRQGAPNARRGCALVVSPLISLMKDQVDGLRVDGVAASYLNSTLTPGERDAVIASLRDDSCRLLYVSPERLVGEGGDRLRRILQDCRVRFIAIDEAHCISQWGHDFRPEYRQLGRLRDDFPGVALHAFTATATESAATSCRSCGCPIRPSSSDRSIVPT